MTARDTRVLNNRRRGYPMPRRQDTGMIIDVTEGQNNNGRNNNNIGSGGG